ncbi:MAG: hypothetical protein KC912_23575, partial [Proteobacteria bacterium]|nr:hypothetical protein [Pseudomonadota bacterium]
DASALKSQATTLRQAIERDLVVVEANWTRAFERATLYADVLVPEAIRARDATLADYRVNRAAFADVLEAEVALLDLERVAILSATETQIQAALVRGLLGVNP